MRRTALAVLVACLPLVACSGGGSGKPSLTVSAAASLKQAFSGYAADFDPATVRLSFAGSDELAAQIRRGARPDVYAAANTKLPAALFAEGLAERPVTFATNRLVLAVPAKASRVRGLADVSRPGASLAIGSAGVPVGDYTRQVLGRLPAAQREAIIRNVRTDEPDVSGIVGKLMQGAVDAGFVYESDVRAAKGALEAIELPASVQPRVAYAAAVMKGTHRGTEAQAFVAGLVHGKGADALRAAGFGPPPGSR
jgi:molybdate transport system substrate-binding protein